MISCEKMAFYRAIQILGGILVAKTGFMLIREIRTGMWNELHHVLTQLLIVEILQRVPVVYWGKGSLYTSSDGSNAFEQFFLPVSGFDVHDLMKEEYTFYPEYWNVSNILSSCPVYDSRDDLRIAFSYPDERTLADFSPDMIITPAHDPGGRSFDVSNVLQPVSWNDDCDNTKNILHSTQSDGDCSRLPDHLAECGADVIVCDTYIDMEKVIPSIPEWHPLSGKNRRDLFAHLIRKYIWLKKDVRDFIDDFYNAYMRDAAFLAVHIRSSDKIVEVQNLHELNSRYPDEIDKVLNANPEMKLFLMTDCIEILEEYKQRYGDILVHTDCGRTHMYGVGVHFREYHDNKQKGLEIIRDTWLAARCDYFIGNGYSNVSAAVSELKDWKDGRIMLLY